MKRYKKAFLAALLAVSMILPLAGCNKGNDDDTQTRKEFYYLPEYHDLDMKADYVSDTIAIGDVLYMFASTWNEDTGEDANYLYRYDLLEGMISELPVNIDEHSSIQRLSADSEGNLVMIVSRYVPASEDGMEDGEAQDEISDDGTDKGSEADEETGSDAETGVDAEGSDTDGETDAEDTQEGVAEAVAFDGVSTMSSSSVTSVMIGGYDDSYEPVEYKSYMELWKVSTADGSVLLKTDIKPVFDDPENTYVQYMTLDDQDNIYIAGGENNIYIMDKEGQKTGSISVDNWVESLFASKEGNIYMRTWGNEGLELRQVDPQNKKLKDAIKSDNLFGSDYSYNQRYYKGMDKGILVSDNNGVFTYDFESDVREDLFEWLDADINSDDVYEMGQLSDGRFWTLLRDYSNESRKYSIVFLKKTPASEVKPKEEIVYGTMWLDQDIRKNIIDFNKTNDKYHISVKTYSTDDYSTGVTLFNNDITSGKGPDIIDISYIDYQQYASKGIFADVYPYMEKDGINKEDYLENVLKAFEVDGKLYGIVPQFYVTTTIAKASKVGDEMGWTLSEMLDFAENNNAENLFQYGSRSSIFYYCIYNNIDEFIDWESGKCKFDGEDFIRVLEFANKFPEEPDYNNEEGTSAKIRSDKLLLMQTSLSSVQEYQMMNGMFGEKTTYIGYPNNERKGNLIQPANGCMAINSKSKHKDGAWEFIKRLISDDFQDGLVRDHGGWGFPVKKSALEKQFEIDMTPQYYEDENGNQVEQMKTSWGWDDFNIDIYAATEEEVAEVKAIIASAERTAGSINEELNNIITEETEAFFKGQKTAKETADIIQNRIQIYVNENG